MLTLRPARIGDLPQITAIYAHAVLNGAASYEYELAHAQRDHGTLHRDHWRELPLHRRAG